jgi:hypothetical protein
MRGLTLPLLPALALACASPSPSAPEQSGGTAPSSAPDQAAAPGASEPPRSDLETSEDSKPTMATPDTMDAAMPESPSSPPPSAAPSRDNPRSQSRLDIAVPSINGGLNRDIIRRTASDHSDDIRDCHGRALASVPNLAGKLVVELWVNERGRVTNAELTGDRALNDRVGQCVVELVMGWTFPEAGGVDGSFKIEFAFAIE